jgi:hypothetical protein
MVSTRSEPLYPKKLEEEERRLYHKGQQSNRMQHDQPLSHGLVWHQGGYDMTKTRAKVFFTWIYFFFVFFFLNYETDTATVGRHVLAST